GLVFIIIVTLIYVLMSINNSSKNSLFYISSYREEFGSMTNGQQTVDYSITLNNQDRRNYKIKFIEPIVPLEIKKIFKHEVLIIEKIMLNKKSKEEIKGQFKIDINQLNQSETNKLLPLIKQYKIIYDDNKEIVLSIYGEINKPK